MLLPGLLKSAKEFYIGYTSSFFSVVVRKVKIKYSGMLLVIALILSSLIIVPDISEGGGAPPPNDLIDGLQYIDGDWYVDDYRNYSNEIIVLTGNLTINATGVLEFVNVTLHMNVTVSDGAYRIVVRDGGHFYVNDTDNDTTTTGDASWITNNLPFDFGYFFQVNKTAILEVNNSVISNCGLLHGQVDAEKSSLKVLSDNVTIKNSEIRDSANGIVVDSANTTIINCTIKDNIYNGVYFLNDTASTHHFNISISDSNISGNEFTGIFVEGQIIDIDLFNNVISNNEEGGVIVIGNQSINATISDNNIISNLGEGGIGLWGTPSQCVIRANFTGNNISENEGIAPIRVGFESSEPPAKCLYVNVTDNEIWRSGFSGDDGAIMLFATDYLQANVSHNEVIVPRTQNGIHIGKLSKEINEEPGTKIVTADIYKNNITNIAAGALRICAVDSLTTNVSYNRIYHPDGLMSCGSVSIGWFKAGTPDTTPNNATVVVKSNIFEGILDSGAMGLKAIYNLNVTLENNTVSDVEGGGFKLGWIDDSEANDAPEQWAYPTRNVKAKINNNTISGGDGPGIWMYSSNDSKIFYNDISSKVGTFDSTSTSGDGIRVQSTRGNTEIFNNDISSCSSSGLRIYNSSEVSVYDNDLDNNMYGIALDSFSKHNVLFNNTITKSDTNYGFYINTDSLNHTIPVNNTVNGEWLRYYYNLFGTPAIHEKVENLDVQEPLMANLGQIIIANSTYVDIMNNTATNGSYGLSLINVENSTVSNNIVRENTASAGHGIYLQINSDNNIIENNNIQDNKYGVGLANASIGNQLWDNTITKLASQTGMYLDPAGTTWDNEIPINNTVNGMSAYYYYQEPELLFQNLTIEVSRMMNVGQLVTVHCSNISLNSLKITNGTRGLYFTNVDNISLCNTELTQNTYNFYCQDSYNITIENVTSSQGSVNYYLSSVENVKIEKCIMENGTNSLYLKSSSPQITNSTIGEATITTLNLLETSHPILLNTTFNKTKVAISSNSNLTVKWYLHVFPECNGLPIEDALVIIRNATGVLRYNVTTGPDGSIRNMILTEYLTTSNNITYHAPYSLNVTKSGFCGFNTTLSMEGTTEVKAVLDDETAPEITIGPMVEPGVIRTSIDTIWLNVTIDDQGYGYSNITNAEWYLSSSYPAINNGTGNPMTPSDGAFDEVNETISATIDIFQWTKGDYTLWFHGTDEANNWCDWKQVNITIYDDQGPLVTIGPTVEPQDIGTSMTTIWLTATLDDAGLGDSNIIDVDWGVLNDIAPEDINASWSTVTVLDGAFNEQIETVTISIDITLWERGNYNVSVRGRDVFDNWGQWKNVTVEIVDDEAPAAPTDLTVRNLARDGKLELTWSPNNELDLAGYNIYRSTLSGSSYQQVATIGAVNTTWEDEGLENGVSYYYVITAFDDAPTPNESPYSDEADAIPTASSLLSKIWWVLIVIPLVMVVFILFFYKGKIFKPPMSKEQRLDEPKAE